MPAMGTSPAAACGFGPQCAGSPQRMRMGFDRHIGSHGRFTLSHELVGEMILDGVTPKASSAACETEVRALRCRVGHLTRSRRRHRAGVRGIRVPPAPACQSTA